MPDVPPDLDVPPPPTGRSDGVLFDNTGGLLHTDTGATAIASLHCNSARAYVDLKFGATLPHYFTWRLVDASTNQYVGDWLPLSQPTGYNVDPTYLQVGRGGWWLVAAIFHFADGQWHIDAEYAVVENSYAVNRSFCQID